MIIVWNTQNASQIGIWAIEFSTNCENHPVHTHASEVIAKIWLIGRAYSAGIERGRPKSDTSEDFYIDRVGPLICSSDIDVWLEPLKRPTLTKKEKISRAWAAHWRLIRIFSKIGKRNNKRSLASKYLYFHFPDYFFIYDSRAASVIGTFCRLNSVSFQPRKNADAIYATFFAKCEQLISFIEKEKQIKLSPRQIDNILLYVQTFSSVKVRKLKEEFHEIL